MGEILVVLVIVVILFGANKLPQLGKGLGEAIRNFKKGVADDGPKPPEARPPGALPPGAAAPGGQGSEAGRPEERAGSAPGEPR